MEDRVFVLIHSPLVGPFTWTLVRDVLRRKGFQVVVPALRDAAGAGPPYWKQHAVAARAAAAALAADARVVLVGHSGTGPLLPAISREIDRPAAAYVFVDAGLPRNGASRLDLLADESPQAAKAQRRFFAEGGRFPNWSEEDLAEEIPDALLRQKLLGELQPRGMDFWDEPLPVYDGWPDAPCAYLQFSAYYDGAAAYARARNWPFRELKGGHFHMLVDPAAVANTLLELVQELGVALDRPADAA